MTQPPGHYGPPGGYDDPYGQPGGGYGDPYGQPSGPPGYGQPSGPPGYGQPSGPPGYGQPSGPPAGYGDPYAPPPLSGPPGYPPAGGYRPGGHVPGGYGPSGGYPPGGGMPPPAFPPQGPQKKGNTGLVIGLSIGGVVLLLCMGLGLFFFLGGGSTSTGTPTASVEGFLNAAKDQDSAAASEYICQKLKDAGNTNGLGGDNFGEAESDVTIDLKWRNVTEVSNDGQNAEVTADIDATVTINGKSTSNSGNWTFELVNEDGWKICAFDVPT